jgi:hypothetical protein
MQDRVQRFCRREIAPERFFHDHAAAGRASRTLKAGRDRAEQTRRNRQMKGRPFRIPQRRSHRRECRGLLIIAGDIRESRAEVRKCRWVQRAVCSDAVSRALAQALQRPIRSGHAEDRNVQSAATTHGVQGREDLLVRQIAGGAEQDQGVRWVLSHRQNVVLFFRPLDVAAKLIAHRGKQPVRPLVFAARAESLEQGSRQDWRGDRTFDRGGRRPAALA